MIVNLIIIFLLIETLYFIAKLPLKAVRTRQIFEKLEKFKLEWKQLLRLTKYGESEKALHIRLDNLLLRTHLLLAF